MRTKRLNEVLFEMTQALRFGKKEKYTVECNNNEWIIYIND